MNYAQEALESAKLISFDRKIARSANLIRYGHRLSVNEEILISGNLNFEVKHNKNDL